MGDVNGDGNPDLVSVGDHGSPNVGTDQHGIMVWCVGANGHQCECSAPADSTSHQDTQGGHERHQETHSVPG